MQCKDDLKTASHREKIEGKRGIPNRRKKQRTFSLRLVQSSISRNNSGSRVDHCGRQTMVGIDGQTEVEFPFLKSRVAPSFALRLADELAEAFTAIKRDPVGFIGAIAATGSISPEKKKRIRAGMMVAVVFYAIALGAIYVSYVIFHHHEQPSSAPMRHLEITMLAPTPIPVRTTLPLLKEPAGPIKDRFPAPTQPAEQPKAELTEAKPTPHPPRELLTEPSTTTTAPSAPSFPTNEPSSRASASEGAVRGLQASGVGTASGGGRGGISNEGVNYNDIFSVSNVTTRPQILARPVPGYTEEARRAQVEGAVRLSVVLNANGTVSDIAVARPLGYGLDQKAIEAVRALRFVPAQKDGHTVSVRIFLEFKFTLL